MTDSVSGFDLTDAVEAIRDQLLVAADRGNGSGVKFEVGPISLEFTVELRRVAAGKAGIKAWVLSGEAAATASAQTTHKVSLVLTPVDMRTNGKLLVGNSEPGKTSRFGS